MSFQRIQVIYLPIYYDGFFTGKGESYAYPSASEVTLSDIGKLDHYQTSPKHSKVHIVCMFLILYLVPYKPCVIIHLSYYEN